MRVAKGGTDVWCPECRKFTTCKGLSVADVTRDSGDREQRQSFVDHPDIAFFQRGRRCLACGHEFVTTEVHIDFLQELMELRIALGDIKRHAERYSRESEAAAEALSELSQSLSVLGTLRIYQETDG